MGILVTGGAGYIGSHMSFALNDADEQFVILDNLSTGSRESLPPGAKLYISDISNKSLVEKIIREHNIDIIIHLAASVAVPDSVEDPLGYYRNNTANSLTLMQAAVEGGVKSFIFSSTAAVYGTPDHSPVKETAQLHPASPYGSSKMMAEMILRDTSRVSSLRHVILRYFNVAGADPLGRVGQTNPNATHLIKVAVETANGQRSSMAIFGTDYETPDGTCIRDFIHVSDLADAHLQAIRYLREGGNSATLNCGYGRGYSVREVIACVQRVSKQELNVEVRERRQGDCAAVIANNELIRRTLNWRPCYDDIEKIVAHSHAWELSRLNLMGR